MYAREYAGKTYSFEASGGLLNGALVMQDFETDSYWAIMAGKAVGGPLSGTRLRELPGAKKSTWQDWLAEHPNTLVLSVKLPYPARIRLASGKVIRADHIEDIPRDPYASYWASSEGFRGIRAKDSRLPTKASIYAFQLEGSAYAVPFKSFAGGAVFELSKGRELFLYRPRGVAIFHSTAAFVAPAGFNRKKGEWLHSGHRFEPRRARWEGAGKAPQPLPGFDTFWVAWSLSHPGTKLLVPKR